LEDILQELNLFEKKRLRRSEEDDDASGGGVLLWWRAGYLKRWEEKEKGEERGLFIDFVRYKV
jgi:hypothetical protein